MGSRSVSISAQLSDRGAEVRFGSVPERLDEFMLFERLLDDAALHTFAASVNQPDLLEPCFVSGGHILVNDGLDVAWRERVKVERVFDRDAMGHEAV